MIILMIPLFLCLVLIGENKGKFEPIQNVSSLRRSAAQGEGLSRHLENRCQNRYDSPNKVLVIVNPVESVEMKEIDMNLFYLALQTAHDILISSGASSAGEYKDPGTLL